MFAITRLKEKYAEAIGYTLFDEAGEVEHFYRQNYSIIEPVSGLFTSTPVSMTAIRKPLIAVLTANITMAVPESRLIEVRDKLNSTAESLNGTAFSLEDELDASKHYSISYNAQTCSVGEKQVIGAGAGEYFPLYQTISYIIIEQGVSSYDAKLKIDNMEIPALTVVVNKVSTSQVLPDVQGIGKAVCQQEVIGFDLTCPMLDDKLGKMFHDACTGKTSNELHYVEYIVGEQRTGFLMMFGNCTESVQPPSNIGFNISLVEVDEIVANVTYHFIRTITYSANGFDFHGKLFGNFAQIEVTQTGIMSELSLADMVVAIDHHVEIDKEHTRYSVFWGDGQKGIYSSENDIIYTYHSYSDGAKKHIVFVNLEDI